LLDAIVRLDGDALVMHVGEKPYVVTTSSAMNAFRGPLAWGQVELSSRVLTCEAVLSMVGQILPTDQREALDDLGAIEHEIAPPTGITDRFTIVAARGGDDIWLELRRHPVVVTRPLEAQQPAAAEAPAAAAEAGTCSPIDSGVAVGLQEPPGVDDVEEITAPTAGDSAISEPAIEETTIEERVPVLDEVSSQEPEHVEHIRIPVDTQGHAEEASLEVVDPEPQGAPTDADVDAMLAATAGVLLTGDVGEDDERTESPDWVILEDGDAARDLSAAMEIVAEPEPAADAGEADRVDFGGELAGMPPSTGSPESDEAAAAAEPTGDELIHTEPIHYAEEIREEPPDEPVFVAEDYAPVERDIPASADEPVTYGEPAVQDEPAAQFVPGMAEPVAPETIEIEAPAMAQAEEVAARDTTGQHSILETHVEHSAAMSKPRPEPGDAGHARVVVPIGRTAARPEKPAAGGRVDDQTLLQMLRVAAERAASTMYVVAQSRPMIRVDGEIGALDAEPVLSASDIERLIAALAPQRPEAPSDAPIEWISEVPEVGRVRCVTFRDHRGPGIIFRMISAKSISADHLNLSAELRDLAAQADGLIVVSGVRGSGKSTLLNSFVDLINRTRSDHVITIETEIGYAHESRRSFISQRDFSDNPAGAGHAALAALKEDPDVLVIEDLHSPESVQAALEAAESGRLVFASITAPSSADAIDAIVEMFPAGQRAGIRATLSRTLRAVVSQMLLRKAAGGRVTARELLLNSPAVAQSIRDGKSSEVAAAVEAGGRHGMVSMNDALVALVRGGTVHSAEAYRRAPDRTALLGCLAREGMDTSFAERLA
jgi:twitching motility protein PilT